MLDASDLTPIKIIPVQDDAGKSSRLSAVYDAALKDINYALVNIREMDGHWLCTMPRP